MYTISIDIYFFVLIVFEAREAVSMRIYTVALFGHRKIADLRDLETKTYPLF